MTSDKQISMSSTRRIYVGIPHNNIHILINQHATFFLYRCPCSYALHALGWLYHRKLRKHTLKISTFHVISLAGSRRWYKENGICWLNITKANTFTTTFVDHVLNSYNGHYFHYKVTLHCLECQHYAGSVLIGAACILIFINQPN